MTVKDIKIIKIFDSRGSATIEAELITELGVFRGAVPAGKSTGANEVEIFAFPEAKKSIEVIKKAIDGKDFSSVMEFDDMLRAADGTKRKSVLGGNVMLASSIAFARARAAEKNVSLWLLLKREFFPKMEDAPYPAVFSNLINGGAHAESGLDIQEYMVVVRPGKTFAESIQTLVGFYESLGDVLRKKMKTKNLPLGDEGGYSVPFEDNFEPIQLLEKLILSQKLEKQYSVALDCAATHFHSGSGYKLGGETLSTEGLADIYAGWFQKSKYLCSIEDPFAETDEKGFGLLQKKLKDKWVVADDLTTTDAVRIRECAEKRLMKGVIIKPNQIGTVSETCEAITEAKAGGIKTIISHRSGETEDNFIISLARAAGADGAKIGAPARERMLKYNELVRVYDEG